MEEEDELEDSGILAELEALGFSQEPQVHTSEITIEEVNVEFDDKDMEDPGLLRDLHALQGLLQQDTGVQLLENLEDTQDHEQEIDLEDEELLRELQDKPVQKVSPSINQLQGLQGKVIEYKKMALKFKKEKNMNKAREALIASKLAQEQIDRINSGFAISPGFTLPDLDLTSLQVASDLSSPAVQETQKSIKKDTKISKVLQVHEQEPIQEIEIKMESKDIYKYLTDLLNDQIKTCTSLSGYYFKSGKKDKALDYHKYKKRFLADLESLMILSKTIGAAPPTFSYFNISYAIEIRNTELSLNDFLVTIVKGYDINSLQGSERVLSVKIDGLDDVGEIPINEGNNPDINYSKKINIQRNKNFQRLLERKKCLLEVYSFTTQFMFLKKKTLIGKGFLKLDSLLNKCEIHEIVTFTDPINPRKSLNSKVEVKLCLSQPLLKAEIVSKQERWIQIGFNNQESPCTTTATVAVAALPIVSKTTTEPLLSSDQNRTPKSKSPVPSTEETGDTDELEDGLLAFKNVDLIASNLVLEHESGEISIQVQALKSSGKAVPADLSDALLSYEIKMNLLVSLVQMGKLTPEAYVQDLNNSLKETKRLAILFKKSGKSEEAQKAMIRIKLMTKEISEIS